VVDSRCTLADASQLIRTAAEAPVIVAAGPESTSANRQRLSDHGVEVVLCDAETHAGRLAQLLDELGRRRMTNVLFEGGSRLLGSLFDMRAIDELHVFIAPKLLGGDGASAPLAGAGIDKMTEAVALAEPEWQRTGDDMYLRTRIAH
jgi:diaminohydroxyphosphoribosylaminopyrimidine deaminase/5-amino-6-(5-phosphoribosylamino)uracil reductase